VLGVLPGILGSLQANEVIKVITGIGEPLTGKLYQFDAAAFTSRIYNVTRDPENPLTGNHPTQKELIDYEFFCGIPGKHIEQIESAITDEITVQELKKWIDAGKDFQLIDVREPYEFDIANLGGELIPKATVPAHLDAFVTDKTIVVHCRSGKRSRDVIDLVREKTGQQNLLNLKGGILAWAKEIDPTIPQY
jgi:adenylyltransferase/sulfurtransferase